MLLEITVNSWVNVKFQCVGAIYLLATILDTCKSGTKLYYSSIHTSIYVFPFLFHSFSLGVPLIFVLSDTSFLTLSLSIYYDLNGSPCINGRLHARLNNQISHPIHPFLFYSYNCFNWIAPLLIAWHVLHRQGHISGGGALGHAPPQDSKFCISYRTELAKNLRTTFDLSKNNTISKQAPLHGWQRTLCFCVVCPFHEI